MDPRVVEARAWAMEAHGDQRYGEHPYVVHLDQVAATLTPFGVEARVMGYLHDIVEDTPVTEGQVAERFGVHVAACVALVTDCAGPNRKARKAATHAKLAAVPADDPRAIALVVKAADRLSNLRSCVRDRNRGLLKMYRREHPAFREAAFRPGLCDALWAEMDRICGP
ncbi:MAG: bifunctional (p)ppGpp synthetase/guanosine-3',5'-bis(diphosphate) 3'-pyrophosphohydrolase [Alphaproteobacteria bacterium]|nr:bifunctional (p)ppGpp synthetase/guanosine-3',5'-bis(diphosphate) 3'-pyrophosphohydrolase [Alphaproteobacteria bacterium]